MKALSRRPFSSTTHLVNHPLAFPVGLGAYGTGEGASIIECKVGGNANRRPAWFLVISAITGGFAGLRRVVDYSCGWGPYLTEPCAELRFQRPWLESPCISSSVASKPVQ